jgi:ribosomal protein S18 acetylase RimI-like enzyme
MSHHVHLLTARHRRDLLRHFVQLDSADRHLRFGTPLADAGIRRYVEELDFVESDVFAVFDERMRIDGAVHVGYSDDEAEMGLSVLGRARGQGIGNSLFERALVRLSNRFVRTVRMHCLRENDAVVHLARKHGMQIVVDGSEADAWLELPRASSRSIASEWVAGRLALLDYSRKVREGSARRVFRAIEG